jgi:hypothetical protein
MVIVLTISKGSRFSKHAVAGNSCSNGNKANNSGKSLKKIW